MVSRLRLMFWRWMITIHNQLHAAMDRRKLEFWSTHTSTADPGSNIIYTSTADRYTGKK